VTRVLVRSTHGDHAGGAGGGGQVTPRAGMTVARNPTLPAQDLDDILPPMNATLESSEAAILDRVFRADAGGWTRAAAEAILSVGFDENDRGRMAELLEKAKAGELSTEEATALENYRHVGCLLELMKSKARRSLGTAPKA